LTRKKSELDQAAENRICCPWSPDRSTWETEQRREQPAVGLLTTSITIEKERVNWTPEIDAQPEQESSSSRRERIGSPEIIGEHNSGERARHQSAGVDCAAAELCWYLPCTCFHATNREEQQQEQKDGQPKTPTKNRSNQNNSTPNFAQTKLN